MSLSMSTLPLPSHQVVYQGDGWRMRLASAADNQRLCTLFREVDMSADLCLAEERDPDFFALQRAQGGQGCTVLLEDLSQPGRPAFGCASILTRPAWVYGQVRHIGYACDLRIEPDYRRGTIFPTVIEQFMAYMQNHEGMDMMFSAVLSSNARGRGALLNQGVKRQGQPHAQVMTAYNMTSLQFMGDRKANDPRVQRAQESDRPALIAFLADQQRMRLFGEVVDDAWLAHRLQQWPGLSLQDFFLLKDGNGQVLACAAPWDTEAHLRRSRVLAYQGPMRWLRRLYNLEARVRGIARLPDEGQCFHFVYLTHLEVRNDNPQWLNALLRAIYNQLHTPSRHFMSLMVPQNSPLEAGLAGFRIRRIPMELIAFTNAQSSLHGQALQSLRPGFEMALH